MYFIVQAALHGPRFQFNAVIARQREKFAYGIAESASGGR